MNSWLADYCLGELIWKFKPFLFPLVWIWTHYLSIQLVNELVNYSVWSICGRDANCICDSPTNFQFTSVALIWWCDVFLPRHFYLWILVKFYRRINAYAWKWNRGFPSSKYKTLIHWHLTAAGWMDGLVLPKFGGA